MATFISRWWRGFVGWLTALDTTRLKRVGVITYFGVYALLFFGIHRVLNRILLELPSGVRPPLLDPVWVVIDLPRSLAMGTFSLGVAATIVGAMVLTSAWTAVRGGGGNATSVRTPYDLQRNSDVDENGAAGGTGADENETTGRGGDIGSHHGIHAREVDKDYHRDERRNYHGAQSRRSHRNHASTPRQHQSPKRTSPSETDTTDEEAWPEGWVGGDEV